MKKAFATSVLAFLLFFPGCRSESVNFSRSLFQHIPDDPELLVLVRPNDISKLLDMAISEMNFEEFFDARLQIDTESVQHYLSVFTEMLEALGIPWPKVESVGVLMYYQKPVLLISGDFLKTEVTDKLKDLGFKQKATGFFDYVYDAQKLYVAADGLMMMAEEPLLEDMKYVPENRRLWNRDDFATYRQTSPLNNSVFVWTHPPKDILSDFPYREDLGDMSLALNFRTNVNLKVAIRVNDPKKAIYLHDIILGIVLTSSGLFGDDPDLSPILKGIKVTRQDHQVISSLVVSRKNISDLKKRFLEDIDGGDGETFENIRRFIDNFK